VTYTSAIRLQNSSAESKRLLIEPWGDQLFMLPDATFAIVAESPTDGCLEIVIADSDTVVYGWQHSTLSVFQSGQVVREYLTPVPTLPLR
jgi:hypothetical protein